MFLSPAEFIGDMPEQYAETITWVRQALQTQEAEMRRLRESGGDPALAQRSVGILRDMLRDMNRVSRTVTHYYAGTGWDDAYSVRGRIRRTRGPALPDDEVNDNSKSIRQMKMALRRCAREKLTDRQRKVVAMYYHREYSQERISAAMGISQQAVHKHLSAARKKIYKSVIDAAENRL